MTSKFLRDHWTLTDELRFTDYSQALVQAVLTTETPFTLAVYGDWGSGKTSLMRMMEQALREERCCCVWFDAWKYDKERVLWRAFLQHVLNRLRPLVVDDKKLITILDDLESSLYRDVTREELGRLTVDPARLTKGILKLSLPLASLPFGGGFGETLKALRGKGDKAKDGVDNLVEAVHRKRTKIHRDRVEFLDQFLINFGTLIDHVATGGRRLVVFVDDLDRCLPEKSIQVLEAIKLFMDVQGAVFVVGVDPKVIERGIEVRYRRLRRDGPADTLAAEATRGELPITGERYIEKIVQLPFTLPPIDRDHTRDFVEKVAAGLPGRCPEVFALGLEANPRRIKRTINIFTLLQGLIAQRRELAGQVDAELLAKTVIIQAAHRHLYADLLPYPNLLLELEAHFAGEQDRETKARTTTAPTAENRPQPPAEETPGAVRGAAVRASDEGTLLARYVNRRSLRDLLLCGDRRFAKLASTPEAATERFRRVYLSLVQTVGEPARVEATASLDELLRTDLLSGDHTKIRAACDRVQSGEADGYKRELLGVVSAPRAEAKIRVSAGDALGYLGDPRFREAAWWLPDEPLLGFVEIPSGAFVMGSPQEDKGRFDDEFVEHEVELPRYYIGRYPLTVAQFKAFVDASPAFHPGDRDCLKGPSNHPVVSISWHEALAYCDWLTEQLRTDERTPPALGDLLRGRTADGRSWRVTLPSEAEWEKAARGPLASRRVYPWGDEADPDAANYDAAGVGSTSAVGCFPKGASAFGVMDLSGNVWEWTRSLWGKDVRKPGRTDRYEPGAPSEDLKAPADVPRVLRGGSFRNFAWYVRCAVRSRVHPDGRFDVIGFRVAVSPFVSDP